MESRQKALRLHAVGALLRGLHAGHGLRRDEAADEVRVEIALEDVREVLEGRVVQPAQEPLKA